MIYQTGLPKAFFKSKPDGAILEFVLNSVLNKNLLSINFDLASVCSYYFGVFVPPLQYLLAL